jgi:hypothetical protein
MKRDGLSKILSRLISFVIVVTCSTFAYAQGGGGENANKKLPKKESEGAAPSGKASEPNSKENRTSDRVMWVRVELGQAPPSNAIVGGVELSGQNNGAALYVCRAEYKGGVHPGKLIGGFCNIGFAGQEVVLSNYQVATGKGSWAKPKNGYAQALIGGQEASRILYVCRANFREYSGSGSTSHGKHPGKIVDGRCNFGFGGEEKSSDNFEVFYPKVP